MAALPPPMMTTLSPRVRGTVAGLRLEEMQGSVDAGQVAAGHPDLPFFPGADREEYRIEFRFQIGHRNIGPDVGIEDEMDAEAANDLDLAIEYIAGKPIFRKGEPQHAARLRMGFEHGDLVPGQGQVEGGGQARRAAPDHGDRPPGRGDPFGNDLGGHRRRTDRIAERNWR